MSKSITQRLEDYKKNQGGYDKLIQSMQEVLPSKKRTNLKITADKHSFTGPLKDILKLALGLKSQSMATKSLYKALIHIFNLSDIIKLSQKQIEPDPVGISMIYSRIESFKSKGLQS